jgi:hypothetical protein
MLQLAVNRIDASAATEITLSDKHIESPQILRHWIFCINQAQRPGSAMLSTCRRGLAASRVRIQRPLPRLPALFGCFLLLVQLGIEHFLLRVDLGLVPGVINEQEDNKI